MPDFSSVRAIFFDLDDTLCGYWDASKAALRDAFEQHAPMGHTPDAMLMHWAAAFREFSPTLKQTNWYQAYLKEGKPTRDEQMRLTLERAGVQDPGLAERLGDHYAEARNARLALFDDAIPVLDSLKVRYPMGLITNGPADIQRQEIETLGIGSYFPHVFIEGELGFGKPHLEVFRRAEAAVGYSAHEMLFVGNSYNHDIRPAVEAGWHTAWIRRPSDVPPSAPGHVPRAETKPIDGPNPEVEIGSLSELLKYLP